MKIEKVKNGTFEKGDVELYRSKYLIGVDIWTDSGLIRVDVFPNVDMELKEKYNNREVLDTERRTNYKWENE